MKLQTRAQLEQRRVTTIADLRSKVEAEDWHGVADAAMDLREIEAAMTAAAIWSAEVAARLSQVPHE